MTAAVRIRGAGVVSALGVGAGPALLAIAEGREFGGFRPRRPPEPARAHFESSNGRAAHEEHGPHPRRDLTPRERTSAGESAGASTPHAAYPAPFASARDLPRGLGRRLGRQLGMSLAAVLEAVGAERAWCEDPADTGIYAATATGPIDETVGFVAGAYLDGPRYASPILFSGALHNAMVGVAARELGVRGPAMVMGNGDVSFETALLAAVAALRAGRVRRAIVVGADAFHPLYALSLSQFGLVADSDEPVDPRMVRTTRGAHLGEGAGALVLERDDPGDGLDGAARPGVRIEQVHVGASIPHWDVPQVRVQALATGDVTSARLHAAALTACGVADARVDYPAARFGSFPSLSAVAVALEAARRLRAGDADEPRPTLFVSAPARSKTAALLLAGTGAL